jgi:hypothetical protein
VKIFPISPKIKEWIKNKKQEFKEKCVAIAKNCQDQYQAVVDILKNKKNIGKTERQIIQKTMEFVLREIGTNLPFVADMFDDVVDDVIAEAKSEVDAFVTHAVTSIGLDALAHKALPDTTIDVKVLSAPLEQGIKDE